MAELYRTPKGMKTRGRDKLNYVAAHYVDTAAELRVHAEDIAGKAEGILNASRERTGASQIEHTVGDVDHYITLTSATGDAWQVEFAHGEQAVAPLRKAAGL